MNRRGLINCDQYAVILGFKIGNIKIHFKILYLCFVCTIKLQLRQMITRDFYVFILNTVGPE